MGLRFPGWLRGAALSAALLAGMGLALADDAPAPPAPATGEPGAAAPDGAAPAPAPAPRHRKHVQQSAAHVLDARVQALSKSLGLDAKQQAAVRQVLVKERSAILELRRGGGQGGQDLVAASHAIVARTRTEIRALLTPEQQSKYFADVPEDSLAPAQADRDYWLEATRPKPAAPADSAAPAAAPPAGK